MRVYAKDAPYTGTRVSIEETKSEIDKILRKYGVTKIAWEFDPEHDNIQLHFQFEEKIQGQTVTPIIGLRPPEIWKTVRGYSRKEQRMIKGDVIYWPQSLRCLFWYIKSHLEMTKLGYSKAVEFLPHVVLQLPDGTEIKLQDVVVPRLNKLNQLAIKAVEVLALEEKKE